MDFADWETYKMTQQERPLLTPHAKAKGKTWYETPTRQPKLIYLYVAESVRGQDKAKT